MVYWSQCWQDEFVNNLLNFKKNGYYLDIGSGPPNAQSNSYFLDSEMSWKGVCIELGSDYNKLYADTRTGHFINDDAIQVKYKDVLNTLNFPKRIDYLSVDCDENSSKVLSALPLDEYRFSVITCEHDRYRFKDQLRNEERECLRYHGYELLFGDVLVPLGCGMGPSLPFEDWWVDPAVFNMDKLSKISAEKMYPDDIVKMIKDKKEIWTK